MDKETILAFHKDQVKAYGGKQGIRDEGLLESALLAQPQASFEGSMYITMFLRSFICTYYLNSLSQVIRLICLLAFG